jgi:DoxX-like family
MTYALWIVQALLALIFVFSGGTKLVLPLEMLTEQTPLLGWFVRFLGVSEVLGAIGLILPGLLGIRPGLTPLAAAGLVTIMIGATVLTWAGVVPGGVALALIPLVVGLLSAFVAYGRWRLAPQSEHRQASQVVVALPDLPLIARNTVPPRA